MTRAVLTRARKLLRARTRREAGRFLAEGPHLLAEALDARAGVEEVIVGAEAAQGPEVAALLDRAAAAGAEIHTVSAREIESVAETRTPQGLVAIVRTPRGRGEPYDAAGVWLMLDGVQDPGNVGTLLRAADAFAVEGIVAGQGTADPWGGKVVRAAQGAHFRLRLFETEGDAAAAQLAAARARGSAVWGATLDGEDVYGLAAPVGVLILALGSEAHGLSPAVRDACSRRVTVPQRGRAESLNVAMAGSVLLSWISRGGGAEARP